ncbi:MAG: hypothetical protein QM760_15085 [Nibricoccus sp.]
MLGSTSTSASANSIFSGNITLNGSVSLNSVKQSGADVRYTGPISGTGGITTVGTGLTKLGNGSNVIANTYSGDTTLSATSSLSLSDNAQMKFVIGASGVNNKITASGVNNNTLTLDGDFVFDLTNAATSGSWTVVDNASLNEVFSSSFTVVGFTETSSVWSKTVGASTYTFSEATGILTAVPEPGVSALWIGSAGLLVSSRRRRAV